MHILFLPSWYPANPNDLSGTFFREQAMALADTGVDVGVIAPSLRSLRRPLDAVNLTTMGCTSFFPSKLLGYYGDSGANFTSDAELGKVIRQIAQHGQGRRYHHIRVTNRDAVQVALKKAGIPTAVHYPLPFNRQPAVADAGAHLPEGDRAAAEVLSLPMHPYIHETNISKIVSVAFQPASEGDRKC